MNAWLNQAWATVSTQQPVPPWPLLLTVCVVAVAAVAWTPVWAVSRNVVTIAHEGAHAIVALACGRRLAGIRLHSDTSGVTVSAGRPTGLGMIATAFAGYVGPSLMGLGAAALLARGLHAAVLWAIVVALGLMLLQIRNFYGALSMLLTGAGVFVVTWYAPASVQGAVAYLLVVFLLVAGPRPVAELQAKRRAGEAAESDADQLAALTWLPGGVWVAIFAAVTLVCAVTGLWWLLPR